MKQTSPAILIGLDATEITLIDQLIADGRMPNLAALRQRGRRGRLETHPPMFLSMVWPTFFTSMKLEHHGWYFNKLWHAKMQRLEYVDPQWMPIPNFLDGLDSKYRVAVLDLPFAGHTPRAVNGVFMSGWQCHDDFGRTCYPADVWADTVRKFGKPSMTPEVFGEQNVQTLLAQRSEVLETNKQFAEICVDYLRRQRWDLFLAVFGATHRGTHYLWDLSQIDTEGLDEDTLALLRNARDECYTSWDTALGHVIAAAPADARILVFALHGMEKNDGWFEYLPQIVQRINDGGKPAAAKQPGLLYRAKRALPWRLVRQVTRRIPHTWNKALVPLWSRKMCDWSRTKYFTLPVDINGYIRLNVRGREAEGIVDPERIDEECNALRRALLGFRDIDSGQPVITNVLKVDDVTGPDAPRRNVLPDLVVLWAKDHGAAESSGVVSDEFGEIRWERGKNFSSGRSGNHTHHGWYVALGPDIEPGESPTVHDTRDLMPTVFQWMGASPPDFFQGKPIPDLAGKRVIA